MSCNGRYADANDFATFWGRDLKSPEEAAINSELEISASDIHAALHATGACECDLAPWAETFLRKLNIIDAAVTFQNPCGPQLSDNQRKMFLDWVTVQLDLIRTGKLELCAGETGMEYPAVGFIEQAVTDFAAAKIIANETARSS